MTVRKKLKPGNSKSLWDAVKTAKDIGTSTLPCSMTFGDVKIEEHERSDYFASFFDEKVKTITDRVKIDDLVYNGSRKIDADNQMFMGPADVIECIKSIKCKNSEGFDRIPQRVLCDGILHLQAPLIRLFRLIYEQRTILEQWRVAKIIPIHKKAAKVLITMITLAIK